MTASTISSYFSRFRSLTCSKRSNISPLAFSIQPRTFFRFCAPRLPYKKYAPAAATAAAARPAPMPIACFRLNPPAFFLAIAVFLFFDLSPSVELAPDIRKNGPPQAFFAQIRPKVGDVPGDGFAFPLGYRRKVLHVPQDPDQIDQGGGRERGENYESRGRNEEKDVCLDQILHVMRQIYHIIRAPAQYGHPGTFCGGNALLGLNVLADQPFPERSRGARCGLYPAGSGGPKLLDGIACRLSPRHREHPPAAYPALFRLAREHPDPGPVHFRGGRDNPPGRRRRSARHDHWKFRLGPALRPGPRALKLSVPLIHQIKHGPDHPG